MAASLITKPSQPYSNNIGSSILMQPDTFAHDTGYYNLGQLMSDQRKQQSVSSNIENQIEEEVPVDDPSKLGRWTLEEKQRFIDGK